LFSDLTCYPLLPLVSTVIVPKDHPLGHVGTLSFKGAGAYPASSPHLQSSTASSPSVVCGAALTPNIALQAREPDLIQTYVAWAGVGIIAPGVE